MKINRIHAQPSLNRRALLKSLGLLPLLPFFPGCQSADKLFQAAEQDILSRISPIDRTGGNYRQSVFSGDDFLRPHQILRDKPSYIKTLAGLSKPRRKEELVIIGGGMSGLMSAYLLSDKKPVILEQGVRFGGNAKAETWNGLAYSIGAAYLVKPDQDSALYKIIKDTGIVDDWTLKAGGNGNVVINGRLIENFWSGASEPEYSAVYQRLYDYFMSFNGGGNHFPDYPTNDAWLRQYINRLDRENFKYHLETAVGAPLPAHLTTLLEHYCFSSLGGSSTEISAAAGINFFAAEFMDIAVFPGGNAYIAEALLKHLHNRLPADHLLPGCLVFDVQPRQDGILICYTDSNNQAQSILTEKAVMCCPKFVANKLLALPEKKSAAISKLEYRAYLVANLLINHPTTETDYDLYWLGEGQADAADIATYAKSRGITDIINANFSSPDRQKTVLSFYQAYPYHGGRSELYAQEGYAAIKTKISAQLKNEVYPYYRLSDDDIVDLRLTRWGHPLPLAAVGLLDSGVVDTLREPIDDRIYFIEQDNWALPAIETVAAEAVFWSSVIR